MDDCGEEDEECHDACLPPLTCEEVCEGLEGDELDDCVEGCPPPPAEAPELVKYGSDDPEDVPPCPEDDDLCHCIEACPDPDSDECYEECMPCDEVCECVNDCEEGDVHCEEDCLPPPPPAEDSGSPDDEWWIEDWCKGKLQKLNIYIFEI